MEKMIFHIFTWHIRIHIFATLKRMKRPKPLNIIRTYVSIEYWGLLLTIWTLPFYHSFSVLFMARGMNMIWYASVRCIVYSVQCSYLYWCSVFAMPLVSMNVVGSTVYGLCKGFVCCYRLGWILNWHLSFACENTCEALRGVKRCEEV